MDKSSKNEAIEKPVKEILKPFKPTRTHMLIEPNSMWHGVELKGEKKKEFSDVSQAFKKAQELTEEEIFLFSKSGNSEVNFMTTLIKSGTTNDKISALTLAIQSSPIHNQKILSSLFDFCMKKSRRDALIAMESFKDLLLTNLLPERKLKSFEEQEWKVSTDQELIVFYFEDFLKKATVQFINLLGKYALDHLEFARKESLRMICDMLQLKQEQQQSLVKLIVNKFGDNDKKLASGISFKLNKICQENPQILNFALEEIQSLFEKPQNLHFKYYSVIFLTQLVLNNRNKQVASSLTKLYFELFSKLSEEEMSSKLSAALLCGLNRSIPFSEQVDLEMDKIFRLVHCGPMNTSLQALNFAFLASKTVESKNRFYRVLYELLLDQRLLNFGKLQMFFNLAQKAILEDDNVERIQAFVKRLLQVGHLFKVPFICASLSLFSTLIKKNLMVGKLIENNQKVDSYDPLKRDPIYAQANTTLATELQTYSNHFHPTVALYVNKLLKGEFITLEADPFESFSLPNFIDRFIQKNPKKTKVLSVMQPKLTDIESVPMEFVEKYNSMDKRVLKQGKHEDNTSINSEEMDQAIENEDIDQDEDNQDEENQDEDNQDEEIDQDEEFEEDSVEEPEDFDDEESEEFDDEDREDGLSVESGSESDLDIEGDLAPIKRKVKESKGWVKLAKQRGIRTDSIFVDADGLDLE